MINTLFLIGILLSFAGIGLREISTTKMLKSATSWTVGQILYVIGFLLMLPFLFTVSVLAVIGLGLLVVLSTLAAYVYRKHKIR
jgi:hypothetical protein